MLSPSEIFSPNCLHSATLPRTITASFYVTCWKSTTSNRLRAVLRSFFRWLVETGHIRSNPAATLRVRSYCQPAPKMLMDTDRMTLLTAMEESHDPLDREFLRKTLGAFEEVMAAAENAKKKHLLRQLVKKVLIHDRHTVEVWYGLPGPNPARIAGNLAPRVQPSS